MACVRKIKDGRWRLDYRDKDGRRYRKFYDQKGAADDAQTELKKAMKDGTFIAPQKIPTFAEVAAAWLDGKRSKHPSTIDFYRGHVDNHLVPAFGDKRLDLITLKMIEQFCRGLLERKLSAKTVNKLLSSLRQIFRYAMKHNQCITNPAALVDPIAPAPMEIADDEAGAARTDDVVREEEVLTADEIVQLLEHAEAGLYRALLYTAVFTGCRHEELLALRWEDVDLEAGRLMIRRSLSWAKGNDAAPSPRFFKPKTKAGRRTLPLPPELAHALRVWKLRSPTAGQGGLLFSTEKGAPLHRSNVLRHGLYPACVRAKLRRIDVLTLRRTFASQLLMDGADLAEVQRLMGHEKLDTTLRHYTHFVPRKKTDSVTRFAARIFPNGHQMDTEAPKSETAAA